MYTVKLSVNKMTRSLGMVKVSSLADATAVPMVACRASGIQNGKSKFRPDDLLFRGQGDQGDFSFGNDTSMRKLNFYWIVSSGTKAMAISFVASMKHKACKFIPKIAYFFQGTRKFKQIAFTSYLYYFLKKNSIFFLQLIVSC